MGRRQNGSRQSENKPLHGSTFHFHKYPTPDS